LGITNGWVELAPSDVDFLNDAACFFACSSASLRDSAIAAFKSGSSSSSVAAPLIFAGSGFGCDWGTYPELDIPLASSKLISSAFLRSSSKLLASTRALRGCIVVGFGANDTRRSEPPLPPDFFTNLS